MVLKKPLTFEEQVLKLEEHGMNISDREIATKYFKKNKLLQINGICITI